MIQGLNQIFYSNWVQVKIKWKARVSIDCSMCDESSGGMKLIGFAPSPRVCFIPAVWEILVKLKKKETIAARGSAVEVIQITGLILYVVMWDLKG